MKRIVRANEIMKREIKSVAMATLCCLMIFTSCAKTTRNVNNDEQVVSKELSTKDATGKDIPEWVKGSLGEGTLFEKVDIDGIGGADDEVYIITGRFDDYGSDYRNGLMLYRTFDYIEQTIGQKLILRSLKMVSFADKDDISSWAIEALEILSNADLFRGTAEGMLDPKGVISIEQAIVLSYRGILLVQNRA